MAERRAVRAAFGAADEQERSALVAFLAAGDPDMETTVETARAAAEAGADVLELGVPFSDPLADGPIIQAAYTRALSGGFRMDALLEALERIAPLGPPVVLMTSLNPVLARGLGRFCRDAAASGASGILVPDLLPEDAGELRGAARERGLDTVFLAAPGISEERLAAAAGASMGFLYLISRRGVTGPDGGVGEGLEEEVARARRHARTPVAVGFGVTSAEDAARVARAADGVIVGSALVRAARRACREGGAAAAARAVGAKVGELAEGIRSAAPGMRTGDDEDINEERQG
ncbi:MAG: tryptophan synthase subunit alpha [bacterium]